MNIYDRDERVTVKEADGAGRRGEFRREPARPPARPPLLARACDSFAPRTGPARALRKRPSPPRGVFIFFVITPRSDAAE